jgi:hypothetical protein
MFVPKFTYAADITRFWLRRRVGTVVPWCNCTEVTVILYFHMNLLHISCVSLKIGYVYIPVCTDVSVGLVEMCSTGFCWGWWSSWTACGERQIILISTWMCMCMCMAVLCHMSKRIEMLDWLLVSHPINCFNCNESLKILYFIA